MAISRISAYYMLTGILGVNGLRLTKKAIDAIEIADKDVFFWDDDMPGFGLKVSRAGRKVFVLQTRLDAKTRRFTIGAYGSPWSPDAARLEARRLLGMTAGGIDPTAEKRERRADMTVADLCVEYWGAMEAHKKPLTVQNEKGLQKRHIEPLLGRKRLKQLQKADVQKFVNDIAAGKTSADVKTKARGRARVTGGKGAANRTFGLLSSILGYAVERKYLSENPAQGVKQFKLKKHDRYLTEAELDRLGRALEAAEKSGSSKFAVAAIRFLALTGCRRNEALGLQWAWVDLERKLAKLPDSKTGQKVMPLSVSAVQLLESLPHVDGSPLVFPSAVGGNTPLSIQKTWDKVRTDAGLADLRLHDLRHNFASAAVSSGQSLYLVGKLLGHSQPQTTQRYAHLAPDPMRAAADTVAAEIATKISGKSSP